MLNVKCRKCGDLRRIERIYKSKSKETNLTLEEIEDNQIFVARFFTTTKTSSDSWLINSGCTNYMTNNEKLFRELGKTIISKVKIENCDFILVKGKWTISIESFTCLKYISDVLFVPNIDRNLLSVAELVKKKGFKVIFEYN